MKQLKPEFKLADKFLDASFNPSSFMVEQMEAEIKLREAPLEKKTKKVFQQ